MLCSGPRTLVLLLTVAATSIACGGDDDGGGDADAGPPLPEVTDPLEWVDPTIGTGGFGFAHGSCFVGAAMPHGLVKVGPDTRGPHGTILFLHYSGYWAGDNVLQGMSHMHLHGTGAADYGVVSIMPTTTFAPGSTSVVDYEQKYAKADESARPGRYATRLEDGTAWEATATTRAAHHRITYPAGAPGAYLVVDLAKVLNDGEITDAEVSLDPATQQVTGRLRHVGGMSGGFGGYDVWFVLRTKQAWTSHVVWSAGQPAAPGESASGTGVGAALGVDPAGGPLEVQVALSLVSPEGAAANLAAELPAWDFDATLAAAEAAWRDDTGVVLVTGGSPAERRMFYTALYHAHLMPTVIADADGTYRIDDLAPLQATSHRQQSDFSLWDTYRTLHPLYVLLWPDDAVETARSLTAFAAATGFFPRWPIATGEAGTMLGASAEIVLADSVVKGVDDFDVAAAWTILRAAALDPVAPAAGRGGRSDLELYMQYGYMPSSKGRPVSVTTEYAHDDFALGQLALALGHDADAAALATRSHGWKLLYDPATGFLRARDEAGNWAIAPEDFDPLAFTDDYAEANAWHSLWMVGAHDADGLAELMGGRAAVIAKLEQFFDGAKADWDATIGDSAAQALMRPYYWHGNEPDMNAAYLFAQLGRPDLTQTWVRWIETTLYTDGPEGLAGNDDGGTLSAWYVFSALGFYPVPGSDRYVVGAPLFPRARVRLAGGVELVVEAEGVSAENLYVQSVTLNGVPVDRPELTHAELAAGGTLRFVMGPQPSDWGRF
jgi:predicted alpha-1,2-mannosidase